MNLKTFKAEISTIVFAIIIFSSILALKADQQFETNSNLIEKSTEQARLNVEGLQNQASSSYLKLLLDRLMADLLAYKLYLKKINENKGRSLEIVLNNAKRGHIWKRLAK